MKKNCSICAHPFEIYDRDIAFYDKVSPIIAGKKFSLPVPIMCPDCRKQRRLAFRNERNLYRRDCSLCKQSIVSIYSADKTRLVYCAKCFWSDQWNAFDYGQDFDFSQPFFPQFKKLFERVPALGLILDDIENSDYNNSCASLKNCYLCFDGGMAQDCSYGETFNYVKDCYNFLVLQEGELCFECINCLNCYHLFYSQFCQNCSDSSFLQDCIGCKNCFGCVNLRNKEYCWFNEQLTKAEFGERIAEFRSGSYEKVEKMRRKVEEFWVSHPKRAYRGTMNENATGDNIIHSHNSFANFDCRDLEDCSYCQQVILPAKDCHDLDKWGNNINLVYNCSGVGNNAQQILCSYYTAFNASNIYHSAFCWYSCSDLFGCVGLNRQKQYCILNKQYTKEEYEALVPKIIAHMSKSSPLPSAANPEANQGNQVNQVPEWGEFFPPEISAFGYNETVAQEYFPLEKAEALKQGFNWSEYISPSPAVKKMLLAQELPDDIKDVTDDILETAIQCESSQKLFVLTKPELAFYRQQSIPLPRLHPNARNALLRKRKNPQKLWQRKCMKCEKEILTSYAPERKELVYCEKCYQDEI